MLSKKPRYVKVSAVGKKADQEKESARGSPVKTQIRPNIEIISMGSSVPAIAAMVEIIEERRMPKRLAKVNPQNTMIVKQATKALLSARKGLKRYERVPAIRTGSTTSFGTLRS